MKLQNHQLLLFLVIAALVGCSPTKKSQFQEKTNAACLVSCHLELSKDTITVGDDFELYFVVKNESTHPIFLSNSPENGYYINGQKEEGIDIRVEDQQGKIVQPQTRISFRSGRFGITQISPNEQVKIRVYNLFQYALSDNDGRYSIQINKQSNVYMYKKKGRKDYENAPDDFNKAFKLDETRTATLVVSERSEETR